MGWPGTAGPALVPPQSGVSYHAADCSPTLIPPGSESEIDAAFATLAREKAQVVMVAKRRFPDDSSPSDHGPCSSLCVPCDLPLGANLIRSIIRPSNIVWMTCTARTAPCPPYSYFRSLHPHPPIPHVATAAPSRLCSGPRQCVETRRSLAIHAKKMPNHSWHWS